MDQDLLEEGRALSVLCTAIAVACQPIAFSWLVQVDGWRAAALMGHS